MLDRTINTKEAYKQVAVRLLFLQGHGGTGEVQDHHHSLLQGSHGKSRPL